MNHRLITANLMGLFSAALMFSASASSSFSVELRRINFITENGNEVTVEKKDARVSNIVLVIHGKKVPIPQSAYADLTEPLLSRTVLTASVGVNGDWSYQLEFPLADPGKDYGDLDDIPVVSFLIEHDRLIERDIYENKTRTKIRSTIKFEKPAS